MRKKCFVIGDWSQSTEIPVLNANYVDPDQTPRSAASDLGLHCLPISFYRTLGINGLIRNRA